MHVSHRTTINNEQVIASVPSGSLQTQIWSLQSLVSQLKEELSQARLRRNVRLPIKTSSGYQFLSEADISFCQADGNYTRVCMKNGDTYLVAQTLKHVKSRLSSANFIRTHQSHAVNIAAIERIDLKNNLILLINNQTVPISRAKRSEIKQFFGLKNQLSISLKYLIMIYLSLLKTKSTYEKQ